MQEAMLQCTGNIMNNFIFVCIEKSPPYAIGCYQLGDRILERTKNEYHKLLADLANCLTADEWNAYEEQVIELPEWA